MTAVVPERRSCCQIVLLWALSPTKISAGAWAYLDLGRWLFSTTTNAPNSLQVDPFSPEVGQNAYGLQRPSAFTWTLVHSRNYVPKALNWFLRTGCADGLNYGTLSTSVPSSILTSFPSVSACLHQILPYLLPDIYRHQWTKRGLCCVYPWQHSESRHTARRFDNEYRWCAGRS